MTKPSKTLDFKLDKKGSVPCLVWNAKDDAGQSAGRPASDIEVALFGEIDRLRGALALLVAHSKPPGDWACRDCQPESETLAKDWKCAYHNAQDMLEQQEYIEARDEVERLKGALSERIKPRWILTSERLPEDGQMVLGYWPAAPYCPVSMESLTYLAADAPDSRDAWRDTFDNDDDEPTHWMPLPEAPK